jgi:uncharacterized membrane protein (DUF2068 family)
MARRDQLSAPGPDPKETAVSDTQTASHASPVRPPGVGTHHRGRVKLHYELLGCGIHGHTIVGVDVAEIRPEEESFVRDREGVRWHRCLRCDAWLALEVPAPASRQNLPSREELKVPLRGLPLRDRMVLRIISVDRVIHFLVLGAISAAIFLFAQDRNQLKGTYTRILNAIQGAVGGPLFDTKHNKLVGDINHLFTLSTAKLYLYGIAIGVYAVLNLVEAVGLWRARRWAEYLTFLELFVLLPIEIYELSITVTTLKCLTLVLNLAIVLYLLIAHRLFGVRGGGAVEQSERLRDTGWAAIDRTTPGFRSSAVDAAPAASPADDVLTQTAVAPGA